MRKIIARLSDVFGFVRDESTLYLHILNSKDSKNLKSTDLALEDFKRSSFMETTELNRHIWDVILLKLILFRMKNYIRTLFIIFNYTLPSIGCCSRFWLSFSIDTPFNWIKLINYHFYSFLINSLFCSETLFD